MNLMTRIISEGAFLLHSIRKGKFIDVYIGIDPINAMWGIFGKHIFRKIGKVIYYTADYADKRFDNPLLNGMYHFCDWLSRTYSHQVWNVSTRILEKRKEQGISDARNYFVPNSPVYKEPKKLAYDKYRLIVVGTSVTALDFTSLFSSLRILVKKFPSISLHIVGELHFTGELKRILDVLRNRKRIVAHGPLSHESVSTLLKSSGIGIALYKDTDPWTSYGDSMKMREYLAAGIPVVSTDIVSTSTVVREFGCGRITGLSAVDIAEAVSSILESDDYDGMRSRARNAARKYSFDAMVRVPLSLVGITV